MNKITFADAVYAKLLAHIREEGEFCSSRNHDTVSHIILPPVTFKTVPVITMRKTAWKKAIQEMAWFMSGEDRCPDNLLDWWQGQLDPNNELKLGYPHQFRNFGGEQPWTGYDQIKFILEGLRSNPNSRRLILTTWHPKDMAEITKHNNNPKTPTSCHNVCTQFFVRDKTLHMKTYQRSADMLLGVPHNWVQSWAMLVYFAHHANLKVGSMVWVFGDAHVYSEPSHLEVAELLIEEAHRAIYKLDEGVISPLELKYAPTNLHSKPGIPPFRVEDFTLEGELFAPITTLKPKLL